VAAHLLLQNATLHVTNFKHINHISNYNIEWHEEECEKIFPKERVCLLDSEASQGLSPEDAERFDFFLIGGILGNVDDFDFDRTSVLREQGYERRSLGNMQMTTDTAAIVTSLIVHGGKRFDELKFVDRPEFIVQSCPSDSNGGGQEMLVMNFRYLMKEGGEADIDPRIIQLAINDRELSLEDLE
jgi:ribosome biogenesis SPOUT family RNA methylase Rps3